jgi:uncharacterized protein (DUF488 family)
VVLLAGLQEFFCRRKRSRRQANRFQEAFYRTAHRIVIINDRDQFGIIFGTHCVSLRRRSKRRNHTLV